MHASLATAGKYLPLVGPFLVIVALITCVGIAKADDVYTGDLDWPYFSDTGRDKPSYFIFAILLTAVGIITFVVWYANFRYQREILKRNASIFNRHTYRLHLVANALGMLSAIGLPTLSCFDTSSYPDLHMYGAYWYTIFEALATMMNTIVTWKIFTAAKKEGDPDKSLSLDEVQNSIALVGVDTTSGGMETMKFGFYWQLVCVSIFWVAFLLYIPIGRMVICEYQHLTIEKCLSLNLGTEYCTEENVLENSTTETILWDYSNCLGPHQMRSVAQLFVMLSLIGYISSFSKHPYQISEQFTVTEPAIVNV